MDCEQNTETLPGGGAGSTPSLGESLSHLLSDGGGGWRGGSSAFSLEAAGETSWTSGCGGRDMLVGETDTT